MLQRTGEDYSLCPNCKSGKMERIASYLNHNGAQVNINELNRHRIKNKDSPHRHGRASPPIAKVSLCNRFLIKQQFTKTRKQPMPINLGKEPFMQTALQTDTIHFSVTKNL